MPNPRHDSCALEALEGYSNKRGEAVLSDIGSITVNRVLPFKGTDRVLC